jgi:transposase
MINRLRLVCKLRGSLRRAVLVLSQPCVPDDLWEAIVALLPRERPRPKGGRPRIPNRAVLGGIILVLRTGTVGACGRRSRAAGQRGPAALPSGQAARGPGLRLPGEARALRKRGLRPWIARKGVESSERLGRYRWVVERSPAWLLGFRRLGVRYERCAEIPEGLLSLACSLICLRFLSPSPP